MDRKRRRAGEIKREGLTVLIPIYGDDEAGSIMNILFEELIGWPRYRIHTEADRELPEADVMRFESAITLLGTGCPLQYVTGNVDFNGIRLIVNPSVLIPRPETAELSMIIADHLKSLELSDFSLLDIGTGSGCIAIFLKIEFPGIRVCAFDVSEAALGVARENAIKHKADVKFFRANILTGWESGAGGSYNIIVSNPPYVTNSEKQSMMSNVRDFEPSSALFVPDEDPLLYYRAIAGFAKSRLSCDGRLYLEINEAFGNETCKLLEYTGFQEVDLLKDFRGRNRFIRALVRSHS